MKTNFLHTIFFNTHTKWYFKLLAWLVTAVLAFMVFYIVGCQDLSFVAQNRVDCEAGPVECNEEQGLMVSPTEDEENMDCGSGDTEGDGCFDVGGGNEPRNRDSTGGSSSGGGDDDDEDPPSGPRKPWMRINTTAGKIDVLFIVDNSKSMTEELASIANQFDPFLDSIKEYNYHIALTTTDWIQDRGQLLLFGNNQQFLSNPDQVDDVHTQNVRYFQELVQLSPSNNNDERGVYVLNMVLDNMSQSSFFRPHSLFMIIIVSDEDERSFGGRVPEGFYGDVPSLESYDLPETFFRKVSHQHKFSMVTVHSIIMPPGGADCPNQCKANHKCIEGRVYADLSNPSQDLRRQYGNILPGHIGSICATNYSSQLGPIADSLQTMPPLPLPCFPKGRVYARVNGSHVQFRVEEKKVILVDDVPFGAEVQIKFRCR